MEEADEKKGEKRKLPTGVYARGGVLWVRYRIPGGEEMRERVPAEITTPRAAAQWRAEQLTKYRRGELAPGSKKVTVKDALDAVLADYKANGYDTIDDAEQRTGIIRDAIGTLPVIDLTTTRVRMLQAEWCEERETSTVNRICDLLRRGCRLLTQETPPRLHHVPYIPRLKEHSPRGKRITTSEAEAIRDAAPEYLRDPFDFAIAMGTRRGQLSRTMRRYVDLAAESITWPRGETKTDEEHPVPLVGEALEIVKRNLAKAVPHCPYLFHGPRCAPGRKPSERWGCLGDFKKAWSKALEAAGVGHRRFHDTRVTFATDGRANGLDESDCMMIGGWKTREVFDRYNLGDLDALRDRVASAQERGKVVALRKKANSR